MIKNWLGRERLQHIVTLTNEEQDEYSDEKDLYETLRKKIRPQVNEMIISLQFHKLVCCSNESVKEWMGRLRTTVGCKYKEQFIHGLNDDEMLAEVIRELKKCGKDVIFPQ